MKRTVLYDLSVIRDKAVAVCHLCLVSNNISFFFFFFFVRLLFWHADIFLHKESRTEYKQTLSRRHFKQRAPSNNIYSTVVEDNLQVDRNYLENAVSY